MSVRKGTPAGRDPSKPDHLGHRRRLRERFLTGGGDALADYELLELLLTQVQPRRDTKPTAKALLRQFGSFAGVLSAPVRELASVHGMGEASAIAIKCVQESALRMTRQEVMKSEVIGSWKKLMDYCRAKLAHSRIEEFHCLFLDSKNALIADESQQTGTVNHVPVYPREIVKRALELGASAVIMVHNHPSGDPTPSEDDIAMTREVASAAEKLGIALHDHVVIGRHGQASFRSLGLL